MVQPASRILHPRTLIIIIGGNPLIVAELWRCRYYSGLDQIIRDISEISHQLPQTITDISGQARIIYKQPLQILFRFLLVILLPTRHSTDLTPMRFSAIVICYAHRIPQNAESGEPEIKKIGDRF